MSGPGRIDGVLETQPVSAGSLPLPSGAATSANQTNGSQKSRATDGTYDALIGKLSTATGTATSSGDTAILSVSNGFKVLIYALSFVPTTSSTTDRNVVIKIGSTEVVGWRTVTAGGGYAESYKNDQWLEGADGEDVVINLSGADSIRWNLKYKLVAV